MDHELRRVSLTWKIGGTFTAVMFILGILVLAAAYHLTRNALRDQVDQRVLAISSNLSNAAAGPVVARDLLSLHALASKYTLLDGVAYALIEDGKGEVIAHTFGRLPDAVQEGVSGPGQRQSSRRELTIGGKTIYETAVPVLDGQVGRVHVGFWAETIEKDIQRALLPLLGVIALMPFLGALLSFVLAHWIVRPIVGLTEVADKVTMGDLETSVSADCVKSRDEIGDLARSLERMRSSLKAAMLRLGREAA
jgi:HAMP domain-containing protein